MLIKMETYKTETGEIVATDYIVTDSPASAMAMINEAEDENVKYHILESDEERSYWAAQMGKTATAAKTAAARINGAKGGRPRKNAQ